MSNWDTEIEKYELSFLLHTEERVDRYRPGGYHPVSINDTFGDGRYTVCHKLGFGGFSTVWLALDGRYVAITHCVKYRAHKI